MDPLLTLALIVPLFFALGVAVQWLLSRFSVSPLNSLLATFGLTAIIEACIQYVWTADFRKLESVVCRRRSSGSATLFVPVPELMTLRRSRSRCRSASGRRCATRISAARCARSPRTRRWRRRSASTGARTRSCSPASAARSRASPAYASRCRFTLTPSQIYAWVGVVFAAVMLGGLGSPLGPLAAGIVIGVSEALTMAFASPSWAPIVSFTLLIVLLLLRPGRT